LLLPKRVPFGVHIMIDGCIAGRTMTDGSDWSHDRSTSGSRMAPRWRPRSHDLGMPHQY
jgi:hypothetical protein